MTDERHDGDPDALAGAEAEAEQEAAAIAADGPADGPVGEPSAVAADGSASDADSPGSSKVRQARARLAGKPRRPDSVADASDPTGSLTAPGPVSERAGAPRGGVEIVGVDQPHVRADSVSLTQGGAGRVTARSVAIHQGGIGSAQAEDLTVTMGGIGAVRGSRVSVELGGVGAALASEVHVTQGYLGPTIAREVHVEQGMIRQVVAGHVTFGDRSGALLVLAGRVDGTVRTLLDWRGAVAFGAAFGFVVGILRRPRR